MMYGLNYNGYILCEYSNCISVTLINVRIAQKRKKNNGKNNRKRLSNVKKENMKWEDLNVFTQIEADELKHTKKLR